MINSDRGYLNLNTIVGIIFTTVSLQIQLETMPTELKLLTKSPDVTRNLNILKSLMAKMTPRELNNFDEDDYIAFETSLK